VERRVPERGAPRATSDGNPHARRKLGPDAVEAKRREETSDSVRDRTGREDQAVVLADGARWKPVASALDPFQRAFAD
jgi:hypothetical protein